MKEAAGAPEVDQRQVPRGGQDIGMLSQSRRSLAPAIMEGSYAEKLPSDDHQ